MRQTSEMPSEFVSRSGEPRLKASYFDASAWSRLARDPKCDDIVAELRRRQVIVLASSCSIMIRASPRRSSSVPSTNSPRWRQGLPCGGGDRDNGARLFGD